MSPHNFQILLTDEAEDDIADILNYTAITWGIKQKENYKSTIHRGLQTIAEIPTIGSYKQDYQAYFHHVGRHIVIYEIQEHKIIVLRLVHDRMNPDKFL
jgi:plasmid stabilization system protein ParE